MDSQPFPLPPEMSQAIAANGGVPPLFEDPATLQVYRLVEEPVEVTLDEEYIRQELAKGIADFDAGRFAPWDIEATIAEAHRLHAEKQK
jgi:hypothetical protein